jgi:hypothetical protein
MLHTLSNSLINNSSIKIISNLYLFNSNLLASLRGFSSNTQILDPYYITGFSDAEASFQIGIYTNNKFKSGYNFIPSFSIHLHIKDRALLDNIQLFFGVGKVYINSKDNTAIYTVGSVKDLTNVIIPHFLKYPLITQKYGDFELFKLAVQKISNKEHLTSKGIEDIVSIKASINKGLSDKLISKYPNIIPIDRPLIKTVKEINNKWLAGFIEGEACFSVRIRERENYKTGYQIALNFTLVQHSRDLSLMNSIKNHLNCGSIYEKPNINQVHYVISKLSDINNKLVPFLTENSLQGSKALDAKDFSKITKLMVDKAHLTNEGINNIISIKKGMNYGRELD